MGIERQSIFLLFLLDKWVNVVFIILRVDMPECRQCLLCISSRRWGCAH